GRPPALAEAPAERGGRAGEHHDAAGHRRRGSSQHRARGSRCAQGAPDDQPGSRRPRRQGVVLALLIVRRPPAWVTLHAVQLSHGGTGPGCEEGARRVRGAATRLRSDPPLGGPPKVDLDCTVHRELSRPCPVPQLRPFSRIGSTLFATLLTRFRREWTYKRAGS